MTYLTTKGAGAARAARKVALLATAGTTAALLAAGCSAGKAGGPGSPGSGISPIRAITLAAQQAQRVTSVSWSMRIAASGIESATITGTLRMRTRPLLFDMDLSAVNADGQPLRGTIQGIVTPRTLYFTAPGLAQRFGKPWVQIPFAEIQHRTGIDYAQVIEQIQQENPLAQAQLLPAAKDVRVVGHQIINGVPTTHYTGTYTSAGILARTPPSLRRTEQKALHKLGVTSARFSVWIDSQHRTRKMVINENGVSEQETVTIIVTAINQPVTITLPPASQVVRIPVTTGRTSPAA